MPGKQMAIDADLNAGLITQDEARTRRAEVRDEADFYGSMDGASKFVRGDAMAGILILVINMLGGLAIGMMAHDMSFGDAARVYTLLAIGDGLVAQIPALLLSTAVAIIVTRMSRRAGHGRRAAKQLFGQPRALAIAAALLGVMGLIPGMPNLAFLLMAALCGWRRLAAYTSSAIAAAVGAEVAAPQPPPPPPRSESRELTWDDVQPVDIIGLEVGYRLVPLVDKAQGGDLLARINGVRRKLTQDLGFLVQAVHIRDNLDLAPNSYRINLAGVPVGEGVIYPERELAINPGKVFGKVDGHRDARSGVRHGSGVDRAVAARSRADARLHGRRCEHRDRHAPEPRHPDACARAARPRRSAAPAQRARQDRAEARRRSDAAAAAARHRRAHAARPARRARADPQHAHDRRDARRARRRARRTRCSCSRTCASRSVARSCRTSPACRPSCRSSRSSRISNNCCSNSLAGTNAATPGLEPGLAERMQRRLAEAAQRQEMTGEPAVLLVPPQLRQTLARFMRSIVPSMHVLAWNEIPDNRKVRLVTAVGR